MDTVLDVMATEYICIKQTIKENLPKEVAKKETEKRLKRVLKVTPK